MKNFDKIGVEIEGAWKDMARVWPWFKPDGSVRVPGFTYHERFYGGQFKDLSAQQRDEITNKVKGQSYSGEIASDPHEDLGQLHEWIEKSFPDARDNSCGTHIHFSFPSLLGYAYAMTSNFTEIFMRRAIEFATVGNGSRDPVSPEFFKRLARYYKGTYKVGDGRAGKGCIINYSHFRHENCRTFECRLFPSYASPLTTKGAVEVLIASIDEVFGHFRYSGNAKEITENIAMLKSYLPQSHPLYNT